MHMVDIFAKIAEDRILEAITNGELANLSGRGKPVDLTYWASLPPEMRATYMLLQNAGCVPEEVQLLKEIDRLREKLAQCDSDKTKQAINKELEEAKLKYALVIERRTQRR